MRSTVVRAHRVRRDFQRRPRGGHFVLSGQFNKLEAPERRVTTEKAPEESSPQDRGESEAWQQNTAG